MATTSCRVAAAGRDLGPGAGWRTFSCGICGRQDSMGGQCLGHDPYLYPSPGWGSPHGFGLCQLGCRHTPGCRVIRRRSGAHNPRRQGHGAIGRELLSRTLYQHSFSLIEDLVTVFLLGLAATHPWLAALLLTLLLLLCLMVICTLFKFTRLLLGRLRGWFGGKSAPSTLSK